jgi:hypothetical protein
VGTRPKSNENKQGLKKTPASLKPLLGKSNGIKPLEREKWCRVYLYSPHKNNYI